MKTREKSPSRMPFDQQSVPSAELIHQQVGLRIVGNSRVESLWRFSVIRTERIRLVVTGTPGNISRIWEVEFYHHPAVSK